MKLIDKDALVAEIEKLYNGEIDTYTRNILDRLKSNIDAIEVKEVDLEKESLTWEDMLTIHRCIKDAMNYNLYAFQTVEGKQNVYKDVLRRFKAQKGE